MSAIGRAAALPPEPLISTLFGGRAAARPIADMYEDHDAVKIKFRLFRISAGWYPKTRVKYLLIISDHSIFFSQFWDHRDF